MPALPLSWALPQSLSSVPLLSNEKNKMWGGRGGLLRESSIREARSLGLGVEKAARAPGYRAEPTMGQAGAAWRTGGTELMQK